MRFELETKISANGYERILYIFIVFFSFVRFMEK